MSRGSRHYRRNRHKQPQQRELKKPQAAWNTSLPSTIQPYKGHETESKWGTDWKDSGVTSKSYTWCTHWQTEVELLNGLKISCSGWADRPGRFKGGGDILTKRGEFDYGVYFDPFWSEDDYLVTASTAFHDDLPFTEDKMPKIMVPWIDRRAPADLERFYLLVGWIIERLDAGDKIEIGCFAAHGRTGTMLASLLVKQGMDAEAAIAKVRADYCEAAVEGLDQDYFVRRLAARCGKGYVSAPEQTEQEELAHRFDTDGFCLECHTFDCKQVDVVGRIGGHVLDEEDFCKTHMNWIENCVKNDKGPEETDEEAYQTWLRLNTMKLAEAKRDGWTDEDLSCIAEAQLPSESDALPNNRQLPDEELVCIDPPCAYKSECNLAEGECWKAVTYHKVTKREEQWEWLD